MMSRPRRPRWLPRERFSPGGFLLYAALITIAYVAGTIAGLRDNTSIICGTVPGPGPISATAMGLGVAYALACFAFMLIVPILVIAAGLFRAMELALSLTHARKVRD
jgi:hypothetical protein